MLSWLFDVDTVTNAWWFTCHGSLNFPTARNLRSVCYLLDTT